MNRNLALLHWTFSYILMSCWCRGSGPGGRTNWMRVEFWLWEGLEVSLGMLSFLIWLWFSILSYFVFYNKMRMYKGASHFFPSFSFWCECVWEFMWVGLFDFVRVFRTMWPGMYVRDNCMCEMFVRIYFRIFSVTAHPCKYNAYVFSFTEI